MVMLGGEDGHGGGGGSEGSATHSITVYSLSCTYASAKLLNTNLFLIK